MDDYKIWIDIISTLAVIISLYYLALQIKNDSKIHKENLEWQKRVETRKALDRFREIDNIVIVLDDLFSYKYRRNPIKLKNIKKSLKDNPELSTTMMTFFNHYESLIIGVNIKIYDSKIVKKTRKRNIINTYNSFSEYILYHRTKNNAKNAYKEWEDIVKEWEEEDIKTSVFEKVG
jgi:hypothetical protein